MAAIYPIVETALLHWRRGRAEKDKRTGEEKKDKRRELKGREAKRKEAKRKEAKQVEQTVQENKIIKDKCAMKMKNMKTTIEGKTRMN